jgi:hypothetical protein
MDHNLALVQLHELLERFDHLDLTTRRFRPVLELKKKTEKAIIFNKNLKSISTLLEL